MAIAGANMHELPCIRCGDCAAACPACLQPQQLLQDLRRDDLDAALGNALMDCTGCARCDAVCPSRIPIAARLLAAQSAVAAQAARRQAADAARLRFERRDERLQRESRERAEREARQAQQAASPDAVAAAIERARARRQDRERR